MARYRGPETSELRRKLIAKGLGQGEGVGYQPWIRVGDFPNKTESYLIDCDLTGRTHHYFSGLECTGHMGVESMAPFVCDIREQFPFHPIEESICLASQLGIAHPSIGGEYCSITTDILLTVDDGNARGYIGLSIKPMKELLDPRKGPRVREKLEIERQLYASRGIPWMLLTDLDLPRVLTLNLRWLRGWKKIDRVPLDVEDQQRFMDVFSRQDYRRSLEHVLEQVARDMRIERELAIYEFRYLAWKRVISVDLYSPVILTKPLQMLLSRPDPLKGAPWALR